VSVPLYQAKAELFRTLGHPVRIRVLELLQDGPKPVRDLLAVIGVEPSNLSQQLAVLRRAGMVTSYRDGPLVMYSLSTPDVADLLAAGRRILGTVLTDRDALLDELRADSAPSTGTGPRVAAPAVATSTLGGPPDTGGAGREPGTPATNGSPARPVR
jgi:ArsR family transcriptional regulator